MLSRSTLLHLRFPFSFFLLPVFLFALSVSPNVVEMRLKWVFLILHFFLYPASNGYNSYFDKDEGSIGGLKNPPPVKKGLYWTSLALDAAAIILGYLKVSALFAVMLFVYGLASKAYSHPMVRLKKYPVTGWIITGFFQGLFTFLMSYAGLNNFEFASLLQSKILFAGVLASLVLWASYPMTQVYQHEEDAKHGDRTMSMLLGVRGTFFFAALFFTLAAAGFVTFFSRFYIIDYGWTFLLSTAPIVLFFGNWLIRVIGDPTKANFSNTMWLNFISAACLNGFFAWLFLDITHLGEYLF